jgi:DNA invertase Pin-like site-specific DNA recombinase
MAVYGYVRVSTKVQADEGLSLEAQEVKLRGYAMMHGLQIDQVFSERAVSGWKPFEDRPAGKRLVAELKSGDTILCAKLDRMFRSAKDALHVADRLKKRGVSLHFIDLGGDITGNGISRVFFTIVAAFAEFERDRIAERVSDVKANERDKGRFLGGSRPFGWSIHEGRLVEDVEEQAAMRVIRSRRSEGHSLRAIAEEMSNQGFRLSHVTIKRILSEKS